MIVELISGKCIVYHKAHLLKFENNTAYIVLSDNSVITIDNVSTVREDNFSINS